MHLQEGAEPVRASLQPHCRELTDRLLSRRSRDAAALLSPLSAQPGLPLLPLPRPAFTGKPRCSTEALFTRCCTHHGLSAWAGSGALLLQHTFTGRLATMLPGPSLSATVLAISARSCWTPVFCRRWATLYSTPPKSAWATLLLSTYWPAMKGELPGLHPCCLPCTSRPLKATLQPSCMQRSTQAPC